MPESRAACKTRGCQTDVNPALPQAVSTLCYVNCCNYLIKRLVAGTYPRCYSSNRSAMADLFDQHRLSVLDPFGMETVMSDPSASFGQLPFAPQPESFADNPERRCPVVLLLDKSGSMVGSPIAELNAGVELFRSQVMEDDLASKRVEVAVVTFGPVEVLQDFVTAPYFTPPTLVASGQTPMGEAITQGLNLLETRKQILREHGISYYRPWVILITDGAPTDNYQEIIQRIRDGEANQKFIFFAIAVQEANMEILTEISLRQPLRLKGLMFREFFKWLSASLVTVSNSQPGDRVTLPNPVAPDGWAEV